MKQTQYKPGMEDQNKEKEGRHYSNNWYFADTRNIAKQILDIGRQYREIIQGKDKPRNHNHIPVPLTKYFYFLFLSGSRISEAFLKPWIELEIYNGDSGTYVQISKVNEKHMVNGIREVMNIIIPIFNEAEQEMWNYITDGGLITNSEEIFQFEKWGKLDHSKISYLIKRNFKTTLKDEEGKTHKNAGITPHILRHMRAYSLVSYRVRNTTAIKFFGWSDDRMLYYYSHINKLMSLQDQLEQYKNDKLLTNLKINASYLFANPMI